MRWDVWGLPCNVVRGVVRYLFRMMTSAVTRAEAAAHAARVPGMAVTTNKVRAHRCVGKTGGRRGQQGPTGRGRKARISARRVSQGRPCRGVEAPLTVVWGRVPVCDGWGGARCIAQYATRWMACSWGVCGPAGQCGDRLFDSRDQDRPGLGVRRQDASVAAKVMHVRYRPGPPEVLEVTANAA